MAGRILVARRVGGYHRPTDPPPPVTPPSTAHPLARWWSALAARDTAAARILAWGDSRTEGEGASSLATRWQDVLAASLRELFPVTGTQPGYVPHNYAPLKYISTTLVGKGEWSGVVVASSPNNFGLGTRVSILNAAGQGGLLTFTGTSLKIAYTQPSTAGSFTYAVDGAAPVTVSWGAGSTVDGKTVSIQGLASAQHTVDVRWASGTVYLAGAYLYNGEGGKGVQFYDGGHSGTRSGNTYGAGLQYVTQNVTVIDPALIILGLGTNDYGGNIDPAAYKSDMLALIAALKEGCTSAPSIVLTLDWKRTGAYTYPWTEYLQQLRDIAAADASIQLFDLQAAFPVAPDNALGYYRTDMVHETDAGQAKRAQLLQQLLTPVAGGGTTPPPTTGGLATRSTPWLPFDMPTDAELDKFADRVVTVHTMATMRRAIGDKNIDTDATAYENRYWMPPGGIENPNAVPPAVPTDHRPYGGFWRNRPLGRAPLGAGFTLLDKRWEVRQMQAAGIGHLNIDILGSDTFSHVLEWVQAAYLEGWRNRVILTPDSGASIVRNGPANLAGFLKQAYTGPYAAALRKWSNGKWLVLPYAPETAMGSTKTAVTDAQVIGYWSTFLSTMATQGTPAVLGCCFMRAWRDPSEHTTNLTDPSLGVFNGPTLSPNVVLLGRWNPRNPVEAASTSLDNAGAPALARTAAPNGYGKGFIYSQAVEDSRPDQSKFEEAGGWDNLLTWWRVVIKTQPEMVQLVTWNDRREGTNIEPSLMHGYSSLDVNSYFTVWYRTGIQPPIVRDGLYLAHREHNTPSVAPQPTYTAGAAYTKRMVRAGATPERNLIDVLVFAKAPAEVSVTVAGAAKTVTLPVQEGVTTAQSGTSVTVPAGVTRVTAPMSNGTVAATLRRAGAVVPGGSVTSPRPINLNTQLVQNLVHWRTSSLR